MASNAQLSHQTQDIVAKALAALKKEPAKEESKEEISGLGKKMAARGLRKASPNLHQEVKFSEICQDTPKFQSPDRASPKMEPTPARYEIPKPANEVLSSSTLDIIKKLRSQKQSGDSGK